MNNGSTGNLQGFYHQHIGNFIDVFLVKLNERDLILKMVI